MRCPFIMLMILLAPTLCIPPWRLSLSLSPFQPPHQLPQELLIPAIRMRLHKTIRLLPTSQSAPLLATKKQPIRNLPYQTNKSKTSSLKTPISSPTPSPKTFLVSSGVGTLFVASALLAISSTIAFFNPCTCNQSATFHNLINLKYAGCGPSRDSCVSVRV